MFDPVAGIHVVHRTTWKGDAPDLRLVDVAAYHMIEALADGDGSGGLLEVSDVGHRAFHALLDALAEAHARPSGANQEPVHHVVQADQQVVAGSTKLGQPLGVLHTGIEHIAVEEPIAFAVKGEFQPVHQPQFA